TGNRDQLVRVSGRHRLRSTHERTVDEWPVLDETTAGQRDGTVVVHGDRLDDGGSLPHPESDRDPDRRCLGGRFVRVRGVTASVREGGRRRAARLAARRLARVAVVRGEPAPARTDRPLADEATWIELELGAAGGVEDPKRIAVGGDEPRGPTRQGDLV